MALVVRDATAEDALEVARVHIRAWRAAYRGLMPDEYLDGLREQERASRYSLGAAGSGTPETILAVRDGSIRGFASIGSSRDADVPDAGELCALYIDPPHWQEGIGSLLMTHGYERLRARGFDEAILWLLVGNEGAERFYRADGWRPDGSNRHENVWGVESHVIRFRRALT
jgi:ribosomal protein S18 acetylase RimI-like enzyme